jgi:hypothetical protein
MTTASTSTLIPLEMTLPGTRSAMKAVLPNRLKGIRTKPASVVSLNSISVTKSWMLKMKNARMTSAHAKSRQAIWMKFSKKAIQPDRPQSARAAGHARDRPVRQQCAVLPHGRSIVLERQPGADTQGYAGLEDGVDYHWWDLAKAAGLSTLLAVGTELAVSDEDRLVRAIRDGAQDTINDAGQQIVRRQLQVAPTLTIRPGFPVRIIVTRDLVFGPYRG